MHLDATKTLLYENLPYHYRFLHSSQTYYAYLPMGATVSTQYNDIYNLYRTYLYRGREFLDSIKLFSKQLKRKKEKRKKKLSSILKTIVLNLISLIFSPLILIGEVLGYICEIIFCIISKKERDSYSAQERERNSNRKGYKKYELIKKEQEERLEDG